MNLMIGTSSNNTGVVKANAHEFDGITLKKAPVDGGQTYVYTITFGDMEHNGHLSVSWYDASNNWISSQAGSDIHWVSKGGCFSTVFMAPSNAAYVELTPEHLELKVSPQTRLCLDA